MFVNIDTHEPFNDPRDAFEKGKKAAGLDWVVGPHDLRHFRATVDLRTVKELLGHANISTTMRYAHFAADHALRSVSEAEKAELAELAALRATNGRHEPAAG